MIWYIISGFLLFIILRRRKNNFVYKAGQVFIEHTGGHVEIWEMQENKLYVITEAGKYSCLVDVYNNMQDYQNNNRSGWDEYNYNYFRRYCKLVEL